VEDVDFCFFFFLRREWRIVDVHGRDGGQQPTGPMALCDLRAWTEQDCGSSAQEPMGPRSTGWRGDVTAHAATAGGTRPREGWGPRRGRL
jgi:hypothetical protein